MSAQEFVINFRNRTRPASGMYMNQGRHDPEGKLF
jgi:hypothetical protein